MEIINPSIYKNIKDASMSIPNFLRIFIANLLNESV